jgi:exportin-1
MVNLTILDWENMKKTLQAKLEKQIDGAEWSWDNINSLCWGIGSISGVLRENEEKAFLINVIRVGLFLY